MNTNVRISPSMILMICSKYPLWLKFLILMSETFLPNSETFYHILYSISWRERNFIREIKEINLRNSSFFTTLNDCMSLDIHETKQFRRRFNLVVGSTSGELHFNICNFKELVDVLEQNIFSQCFHFLSLGSSMKSLHTGDFFCLGFFINFVVLNSSVLSVYNFFHHWKKD